MLQSVRPFSALFAAVALTAATPAFAFSFHPIKATGAAFNRSARYGANRTLWEALEGKRSADGPNKWELGQFSGRGINWWRGQSQTKVQAYLESKIAEVERQFGSPITTLTEKDVPSGLLLYKAERAAAMKIFNRNPGEIAEGFVTVGEATIDVPELAATDITPAYKAQRITIPGRRIFFEDWQTKVSDADKKKIIVVVSPGFEETGRKFYEQIQWLNEAGYDALPLDHQWAGYSQPGPNGPDTNGTATRGLSVTRDSAAKVTFAMALAKQRYGDEGRVVILGDSYGAGPGGYGPGVLLSGHANVDLNLQGSALGIDLKGLKSPTPEELPRLLQSPFVDYTRNKANNRNAFLAKIPGLRNFQFPSYDSAAPSTDSAALKWWKAGYTNRQAITERARTLIAAQPDLGILYALSKAKPVGGRVVVLQAQNDGLADPAKAQHALSAMAGEVRYHYFPGTDHPLADTAEKRKATLEALEWLTSK